MQGALIKIIKAGTVLALLTPLVFFKDFYFPFVGPKSLYFMGLAEIVFFAWLALAFKFPKYRPRLNAVTISLAVLLAAMALSSLLGANPSQSFWSKFERMTGLLMWLHLFGFYLVAASVFEKKDWIRIFGISIFVGLAAGLASFFGAGSGVETGETIGNDSFLGTYILFNLFFAAYLLSDFVRRGGLGKAFRRPAAIALAVAFAVLALCLFFAATSFWADLKTGKVASNIKADILVYGARAAKLSFLGGLFLILLLWLALQKRRIFKWVGFFCLSVFAIGVAALIFFSLLQKDVIYRKLSEQLGESTLYERIVAWDIAWKGFQDKPFLGWGPENYEYVFAKHYNSCLGSGKCGNVTWYDRAHNIVLDTLVSTGILGLLAYLAVFVSALFVLWKAYFSNKVGFSEAGVFTGLFAAYFMQNLTVFDTPISLMVWFLSLAFIASITSKDAPSEITERKIAIHPGFIAFAFFVCFTQFVFNPVNADHSVIVSVNEPFGSVARLSDYKQTLDFSPTGRYQIRQFFAQTFLIESQKGTMPPAVSLKELEFLSPELEKSVLAVPQDYKSYMMLTELYLSWVPLDAQKLPLAEKNAQRMIELSPTNQKGYWMLAQARIYQNNIDDALKLAQKAYDLSPENFDSLTILNKIKQLKESSSAK